MGTTLLMAAVAVLVAAALGLTVCGRRLRNWGATPDEIAAPMTGDGWLEGGATVRMRWTKALWIEAPADRVWPWLAQMGRGAGWYSYDRLDNGGRPSARHIVSWIPEPGRGDATPIGYLRWVEPGREVAWWLKGISSFGAHMRSVMVYRIAGEGARTRLVFRNQADARGALAGPARWVYRVVDGIMARRQLVGIKERAERCGSRRADPDRAETGARDQFQLYHAIYASGEEAGVPGREQAARWHQAAIDDGVIEAAPAPASAAAQSP